jgi:hypothetical protein
MKIMTNSNHVACDYVATILFKRISLWSHPPDSLFLISAKCWACTEFGGLELPVPVLVTKNWSGIESDF